MTRLLSPGQGGACHPVLFCLTFVLISGCGNSRERAPEAPITDQETLLSLGRSRSMACMGCHGPQGVSRIAANPSLAGLSQEHLSQQLRAFRSGARANPTMSSVARSLSDNDIAALSHYYASLPSSAETPAP